jgi:hypothetical protein
MLYNSMIQDWDTKKIKQEIEKITAEATQPRTDGFVTWGYKQQLYELLWFVEDELDKCSSYTMEKEFLKKRDKELMLRALGKK